MDDSSQQVKLLGFEFWEKKLNSAKLIVAPMVDQSELAWRLLSRRYGAELCYTPMYHASVFVRDANYRKDALAASKEDRPLIIQFCANDPEMLLRAARYAEKHCEAIDLNLGCPQAIAKRGHYGAFLQDEWDLLERMVSLCAKELQVPITCKIRIFEDMDKTVRYAQMLEKAGCQLLTVHGRTKEQKGSDTGIADWKYIKAVKEAVRIPVFANGNIQYLSDVHRCMRQTGVDGVMTAEGNLHNPALFDGLQHSVWDMAEEYLVLIHQYPCPMSYIRGHMFKLLHHVLLVHTSQREVLGNCKLVPEVEKFVKGLKQLSEPDMKKYEEDPVKYKEMYQGSLTLPYWICQPYVRPTPEETEQKQRDKLNGKRPLGEVLNGPEEKPLSRNKLKKLRRNPCKMFEERREKFQKCTTCGNPKGLKCVLDLCKACCKKVVNKEKLDCPGHKLLARTRHLLQLKLQQEAMEASSGSGNLVTDSTDSQGDIVPSSDTRSASMTERDRDTSVKHDTCVTDIGTLSMHSTEANYKAPLDIFNSAGEPFQETPTSNVEAR